MLATLIRHESDALQSPLSSCLAIVKAVTYNKDLLI